MLNNNELKNWANHSHRMRLFSFILVIQFNLNFLEKKTHLKLTKKNRNV